MAQVGVSWIYKLRREELVKELIKYRIEDSGTVPDLKKRLVNFVKKNPQLFKNKPQDEEDYDEEVDKTIEEEQHSNEHIYIFKPADTSTPTEKMEEGRLATNPGQQSIFVLPESSGTSKVLDQMRKWNCHFDGKDVYAFLERIDELRQAYDFSEEQAIKGFPELLRGEALLWFRNERENFNSWDSLIKGLKEFFLSPQEQRNLRQQIFERKQKDNESIRSFVTALGTLMRRYGEFNVNEQLDSLYYNMRPEFRLYVPRESVTSQADLVQKVEKIEETTRLINKEKKKNFQPNDKAKIAAIEAPYNNKTCCWKCKKPGHSRIKCKNKQRKFCSYCGTDGVWTRDCSCHPTGNAAKVDPPSTEDRPNV